MLPGRSSAVVVNGANAPDGVHLLGLERGRGVGRRQRLDGDVVTGQAGLLQGEQEQEVVHRALLDRDRLALEVGDRVDALSGDDLVVAGGVVVHQHDGLPRRARCADRDECVVQGLAVGVTLPVASAVRLSR